MSQAPKQSHFFSSFADFMMGDDTASIDDFLVDPKQAHLLTIYRNGFYKSAISALKANFPSVVRLLGEDYFKHLAADFARQQAPVDVRLVTYGQTFSDYLDQHLTDLPYISDFARLDWQWLCCLNEKDEVPLTAEAFQVLLSQYEDMDELPIQPLVSIYPVALKYPVIDLWTQLKQGDLTETNELSAADQWVIFWKTDRSVRLQDIPQGQYLFISQLAQGAPLTRAAEQAISSDPDFDLGQFFATMLEHQLLKSI